MLSATVYQMVIAKAGTAGNVVYIRSYTPLNNGDSTKADSTQIVLLNNANVNEDSVPTDVVLEDIIIDPSIFGRGSSYREIRWEDIVISDTVVSSIAAEPQPFNTPVQVVSNTAATNASQYLNTPK